MRCTFFMLFCVVSMTFADTSYAQEKLLSISSTNKTVREVLSEIEKASDFVFFYNNKQVDVNRRITVNVENFSVADILHQIFENSNVAYELMDNNIVLYDRNAGMDKNIILEQQERQQQGLTVQGQIVDSTGEPITGASVLVEGTTNGTISDLLGNFSLSNVPANGTVVVSFVGYKTQNVHVSGKTFLKIVLIEDTELLEEVVVVGYGVQRKSDVTGAISVASEKDLLARPQFNAMDGLRGKAAGVTILSSTGNPLGLDEGAPRVIIRGMNSVNSSNDPLFVVDGVQMSDFQFVNPNDIERMEVLKDASATAIYGARGANGVILVTTKRGNTGKDKTVVTYNGYVSLSTIAKKVDLMNAQEFLEMEDIAFANLSKYPAGRKTLADKGLSEWIPRRTDPLFFDENGNPLYDTDWQDAVTRKAISHSHQLNVQHQGNKTSFGAFVNYTDQQAILLNNYAKRMNAKMTIDSKPNKYLDISVNLLVNHVNGNTVDGSGNGAAKRNMWEMPPIVPVKFPNGAWGTVNGQTELDYGLEAMANPVQVLEESKLKRKRTKIFGNMALVFHLADGLDLRTQYGLDYNITSNREYLPTTITNLSAPRGRASISDRETYYWQEETYLSYNKVFKDIHRVNATLGMSWSQTRSFQVGTGTVYDFSTDLFGYNNLAAGTTPSSPTSYAWDWAMNSYFARLAYTLKDRYMFTGTIRADGSSRFGKNNKYGYFPSIGLGWNISNEPFLRDVKWLSNLKLHASYGQTGNTEINTYQSLALMSSSTILMDGNREATAQMSRMANPDLKWERTEQFDAGFNLSLFDHRVNIEFDYYHKMTKDLLLERPLPYETGFASVFQNMGRVDNSGIEFMLHTRNFETKNFSWETTFNFNYNKNEIKKLGENNEDIVSSAGIGGGYIIHRVGESLASFYAQKRLGTWSTAEAEEAAAHNQQSPGEAKKTTERYIVGNGIPQITGSFINKLNWKNFDFTLDIQYVTKVDTWEAYCGAILDRAGVANGLKLMSTDGWREDRQNTMVQQIRHTVYAGQSSTADSYWVSDGSYIRGNLIQLGYTFDNKVLQKLKLQNLRLNLSISNAFLITAKGFRGYDPESSANTGKFGQNIYFYQYPRERTYTFGVNFSF